MKKGPIIIAGFGRSGTTWLSDIVSKSLGGLILFEPFHPVVCVNAHEYCYNLNISDMTQLRKHLDLTFNNSPKNYWLLRNHLPGPIENISESYVKYIWENTRKIGFKTIRLNHSLSQLKEQLDATIIYIYRHPLSVICSINSKLNFWKEFGWNWHKKEFFSRTLIEKAFQENEILHLNQLYISSKEVEEQIIIMWAISFILSLKETAQGAGHIICYEDLYLDPYRETAQLIEYINGCSKSELHPSYFFTPSMTSLGTLHNRSGMEKISKFSLDEIFWKNKMSVSLVKNLKSLLSSTLSINERALALAKSNNYI